MPACSSRLDRSATGRSDSSAGRWTRPDLTLPRLQRRWHDAGQTGACGATGGPSAAGPARDLPRAASAGADRDGRTDRFGLT